MTSHAVDSAAAQSRAAIGRAVVGRSRELTLVLAAVAAGRDILLEGPPGTSKSTMLRAITKHWNVPFYLVEGNAELTPARLVGHHNPARVLREDYSTENFVPGPLIEAMQTGGFLYIEELNRAPEDTLNVLLGAMAERSVTIPRVGPISSKPTFRVLASMNPFDNVGTARISDSVYDRWCRLAVGYQSSAEERDIVARRTGCENLSLIADAVALVRATREHPELQRGSSVRGAIDLAALVMELERITPDAEHDRMVLDAALLALSARIGVDETSDVTPEQVITEIWESHFFLHPRRAAPGAEKLSLDNAVTLPTANDDERRTLAPLRRRPKALDEVPGLFQRGAGAPVVAEFDSGRGTGQDQLRAGGQGVMATAQKAVRRDLDELLEDTPPDPTVWSMAGAIARRLSQRRRPRDSRMERGTGPLASVPYAYRSDDIDLDKTIEILVERPAPEDSDVVVRERMSSRRAAVLIVDVSGSMRGEKVRIAAATVAALSADLSEAQDQLALVAFWSDAALVKGLAERAPPSTMLDTLLRIPARGLTNVGFGLSVGHAELARSGARRRTAILLTDAVHNSGPDPREFARRFGELHVLLETDGEHDLPLGRDLARLGGGVLHSVQTHRDVAPALNMILNR